tara:strand:- start:2486 stop:3169 length:684 start_codon:yes stop_codon:yes gene_type:complete
MKVIVTGGASGIGKEVANYLISKSYEVISVDLQEENGATNLDVVDEEAWEHLFQQSGPVQGLVNCAGIRTRSTILETSLATFEQHLKVNVTGTWLGIKSFFKSHEEGTKASIVNISSVNALIAVPGQAHYVASKGAISALTKAAAIEGAPLGIRVNAIGPGAIQTPMTEERLSDPEQVSWLEGRVPLGRVGEANEIASVTKFLLSSESSYITGTTIFADGGWTSNGV